MTNSLYFINRVYIVLIQLINNSPCLECLEEIRINHIINLILGFLGFIVLLLSQLGSSNGAATSI